MRWPAGRVFLIAFLTLVASTRVARSADIVTSDATGSRSAANAQPDGTLFGVWSSNRDTAGFVQIMRYPGQMIRIVAKGRFEAVGYQNGPTAVCVTCAPGPPRSEADSVRYGMVRLLRRDPHIIQALFAQDPASAPMLEEMWTFRGIRPEQPTPAATRADSTAKSPAMNDYVFTDELPEAIAKIAPIYPDLAREANITGVVMVKALLGKDGRVKDVQVVKSIPALDSAAVASVRQWLFKPATAHGAPVEVWVAVPVKFTLH